MVQLLEARRQKIKDRRASMRVLAGAKITARLVEGDDHALALDDGLTVHRYGIAIGHLRAQIGDTLIVDHHPAVQDDLFASPARAQATNAEKAIQAHGDQPYSGLVLGRLVRS